MNELREEWLNEYAGLVRKYPADVPVIISPYFGNYGLAGYVICGEGSPVQATAVFDLERCKLTLLEYDQTMNILGQDGGYLRETPPQKQKLYETTKRMIQAAGLPLTVGGSSRPEVTTLRKEPRK